MGVFARPAASPRHQRLSRKPSQQEFHSLEICEPCSDPCSESQPLALEPEGSSAHEVPMPPAPTQEEQVADGSASQYTCHCGKVFPNSSRYHRHLKLHSDQRSFRCPFPGCQASYKRKTHLDRHVLGHEAVKPYACDEPGCTKSFASKQKFQKHVQSHNANLQCNLCGKRFKKRAKLAEHMKEHQSRADPGAGFRCEECGTSHSTALALERHMKSHKAHACDECELTFRNYPDLAAHKRQMHSKAILCPECGKTYHTQKSLQHHIQTVHADMMLICPHEECGGLTFSSMSNFKTHERVVHLGLRPYECKQCGDTFAYKHVLRRHCKVMHSDWTAAKSNGSQGSAEVRPMQTLPQQEDVSDARETAMAEAASSSRSNPHVEGTTRSSNGPIAKPIDVSLLMDDAEILASASSSSQRHAQISALSLAAPKRHIYDGSSPAHDMDIFSGSSSSSSKTKVMEDVESVIPPLDDADSGFFIRSGARARKRRIIGCSSFKCSGAGGCTHQLQSPLPVQDFFLPLPAGDDPTL